MDPSSFYLITLVVLILISAVFSASETALYSLSPPKIKALEAEKAKGAKRIAKIKSNPNRMLVTILLGNNLVNVGSSSLATVYFTQLSGSYGIGIATGIMTLAILIFGEILPKSFASKHAVKVSQWVIYPLSLVEFIFKPLIYLFETALSKLTGDHIYSVSEEEVMAMVSMGAEEGSLEKHEKEFIENVLEFNEIAVEDIMVPRSEIFCIDGEKSIDETLSFISEENFSRIPVYIENKDNIIGFVTVKMILKALKNPNNRSKKVNELELFKFVKTPTSRLIHSLFLDFQKQRTHMALVLDERGDLCGLITMEDILEEIVGDIVDESDTDDELEIKKIDNYTLELLPTAEIGDIEKSFDVEMPEFENVTSISKAIVETLKRFAKLNEVIRIDGIDFKITELDKSNGAILKLTAHKPKSLNKS